MRGFRIGIVSPFSAFGKRIRDLLQERAFPTIELKLFETGAQSGSTLTEFRGEIVVTQSLDPDLFPHLDLLFFGNSREEDLADKARAASREGVLTVVSGGTGVEAPVMAMGINDRSIPDEARLVVAAGAPSLLIGTLLAAIGRSLDIVHSCATVLLPAADAGEEAVEELHQQMVKILNFQTPPTDVSHEQIAFNAVVGSGTDPSGRAEETVSREAAGLAGLDGQVSVSLVRVPVFHGYAAMVWVRLAETVEPEALVKTLKTSRRITVDRGGKSHPRPPSPVSVGESEKIHVGHIRPDRSIPGGYWLWAVADSLALDPAAHAVRFAERALGVSRSG